MKRFVWFALFWAIFSWGRAAYPAEVATINDAEREKIRAIVREVMREYAAVLDNKKQNHEGAAVIVGEIRAANRNFMRTHAPGYFKPFLDGQHPRATVVACSDSRVHTHALDATPDGDLFVVRNIGNQLVTAEGSVEYGVHHLHTPLLLILGHTACGAIKAAAGDYSQESVPIRRELDSIQIPKGDPGLSSVKLNVNNQVRLAVAKYEKEVMSGQLTVVGAVYDFRNEMKQGQGRINIVNVNGETDVRKISAMALMKEVPEHKAATHRYRPPAPRKSAPAEPESEAPADEHEQPAKKAKAGH